MNFDELLKGIDCECGRHHTCDIKKIVIESGAIERLPELAQEFCSIVLVADTNTYAVCGERVRELLAGKLESLLVIKRDGVLVPNEEAIAELDAKVSEKTDLIVGIGSGVIQDLSKYVSFRRGLPYFIIATAPSMDGYASVGAAMITDNMKVTYTAHVPHTIIGDTDILKDAPMDMIKSGWGDIIGKYSCLNDWKLARLVNGEYFCRYIYDLTYAMVENVRDIGPALLRRDPEAIRLLMEALIGVGVAMAYAGNSRPGSGSEHHMSHYYEIVGIVKGEPYLTHGTDVVFSTIYTQRMREELLTLDAPMKALPFDREKWESNIRRIYGKAADGVIALQDKLGWYADDKSEIYVEKWSEIREILAEVPKSSDLLELLASAQLDISLYDELYGEAKIDDAVWFAKDLKDRYTVLWLYDSVFYGRK